MAAMFVTSICEQLDKAIGEAVAELDRRKAAAAARAGKPAPPPTEQRPKSDSPPSMEDLAELGRRALDGPPPLPEPKKPARPRRQEPPAPDSKIEELQARVAA
jgi:hypothetical protein